MPSSSSLPDECAISVLARPASSIPASDTPDYARYLAGHVEAAFRLIRQSRAWKQGKQYHTAVGGAVNTRSAPSNMQGKAAKLGWHLRDSIHNEADTGLTFDDFRGGLLVDHQPKEREYIHDVIDVKLVQSIKEKQAEVWRNSYQMPALVGNRDFLQLQLMLDLPRHAEPFSEQHQQLAVDRLLDPAALAASQAADAGDAGARSFIVIQLPVEHPDEPERKGEFVRGAYGSVEVVWEVEGGVEWLMMVQSDAGGKIPLVLQEMSMNGKIAEDVPSFVGWAQKAKPGQQA
ncbi:uncharacterized protein PFL1_01754 [Pseudozyma flocculosa PF-1]|uniref:DUF3074 domain-containing protein n=1 Tax=Pseudozyma flocculosa TaxID=84751 RepID=A0A5C3F0I0_9BASI|nr:uncharacterized protein PFL1_01754 [Pseudozyma flocculosa PF-1]EPQ30857.1 hypothetical protein PFL1_01754 [Pseudozyma flocculosa PF-1]SPO36771.1 uncharacterized protein PSFLO_02242 [Pseudozyma flocculosa]